MRQNVAGSPAIVCNQCQCDKMSQPPSGASGSMLTVAKPTISSGATKCRAAGGGPP
jgi:hypothetical protein